MKNIIEAHPNPTAAPKEKARIEIVRATTDGTGTETFYLYFIGPCPFLKNAYGYVRLMSCIVGAAAVGRFEFALGDCETIEDVLTVTRRFALPQVESIELALDLYTHGNADPLFDEAI